MIRNQKSLLPSHKHRPPILVAHGQQGLFELALDMPEGRKTLPVGGVLVLGCAPILGEEAVATSDDLGVEIRRELRPVVRETPDAEVPAEKRRRQIDILDTQHDEPEHVRGTEQRGQQTTMVTLTSYEFRPLFWVPWKVAPGKRQHRP